MEYIVEKTLITLNKNQRQVRILQIGPGFNTFHYIPAFENPDKNYGCLNKTEFPNCHECPLRYECVKGNTIIDVQYQLEQRCYDQIIIAADISLPEYKVFKHINQLLKYNGEILFFIKHQKWIKNLNSKSIYFKYVDIIKLINSHHLSIESINNIRDNHNKGTYCIICKN